MITFSMNDEPHLTPRKEAGDPIHYCITEDQLNGASSLYQVTNKTGFIIYESMDYQTALMLCLDVQDLNKVTVPDAIVLEDKERKLFKNSINHRATLDSLRADMAKKEKAVREIEQTIEGSNISDPEVAAKLNTALKFAEQELQKTAGWVTTAEQVLGGTFLQQIGKLEQQRRESDFLENGTRYAESEDFGKSIYTSRRR